MNRLVGVCVLLAILLTSAPPLIAQDATPHPPSDYIARHQDDLAVVCFDPVAPELGVYHNASERFPLATTLKLAILAAYAERIAEGDVALDDTFAMDEIDAYFLPGSDARAYTRFGEEIVAGRPDLTLDDLLGGMIVYSSDAIADFLLARLDAAALVALYQRLGITSTDTPSSTLGLYLVMSNHETGIADPKTLSAATFWQDHARLAQKYLTDATWRQNERAFRARPDGGLPDYATQTAFLARFGSQGTAADVTALIQAAYGGETLSVVAQQVMRRYLDWPLSGASPLDAHFIHFGVKNDAWPGVLATTYYTIDHDGQATAMTVLLRQMPLQQWSEWLASLGHIQLELEAIRTRCDALEQTLVY